MSRGYDVVIIGAGSVGIPAAWAMARAGVKVLVLDRFSSFGQGSSKSAIGGIRATHSDPAKIRLGLRSIEIVSTWEEAHGQDIEWVEGGYSFVAYRKEEEHTLKALLATQHRYGLNIDWYDKGELLEIIPPLNPDGLIGGTFSPQDGHCSPLLLSYVMYDGAVRAGAKFHFREEVVGIDAPEGRIRTVRTDKGTYETRIVLNAAGGWASEVGRLLGLDHPIVPESHEAPRSSPRWSSTSGRLRARPTTTSSSTGRVRSSSASPRIRRSPDSIGARRAASSRWSPGGWSI